MPKLRLEFSAGRDALPRDPALHVQKGCKFKPKLQNGELLLVLPMVTGRISLYEGGSALNGAKIRLAWDVFCLGGTYGPAESSIGFQPVLADRSMSHGACLSATTIGVFTGRRWIGARYRLEAYATLRYPLRLQSKNRTEPPYLRAILD